MKNPPLRDRPTPLSARFGRGTLRGGGLRAPTHPRGKEVSDVTKSEAAPRGRGAWCPTLPGEKREQGGGGGEHAHFSQYKKRE